MDNYTSGGRNQQYEKWEAGDVQTDIQELRRAINKNNANRNLQYWDVRSECDYVADNYRPVFPDVMDKVVLPLAASHAISLASAANAPDHLSLLSVVVKLVSCLMDAHYYTFCLFLPLVLWILIHRDDKRQNYLAEFNGVKKPWVSFILGDSRYAARCTNHCLCLIDLVTSCVLPSAIFTAFYYAQKQWSSSVKIGRAIATPERTVALEFMMAMLKLITRLGAVASLHQYSNYIFELRRPNQPRPVQKYRLFLRQYVQNMSKIWPFGFSSDLIFLNGIIARIRSVKQQRHGSLNLLKVPLGVYGKGFLASVISPLFHIFAFCRLINIFYGSSSDRQHWPSGRKFLTLVPEDRCKTEADYDAEKMKISTTLDHHESKTLRWLVSWRRPRRVEDTIERWFTLLFMDYDLDDMYEPFYTDPGEISLQRKLDVGTNSRNDVMVDSSVRIMKDSRKKIWSEINAILKDRPDPLGMAVERYFGIKLTFKYDHTREVGNETPSINRLRARVAKSSIKRMQQLENKLNEQVGAIEDPDEKAQLSSTMKKDLEKEQENLAKTLLELENLYRNCEGRTSDEGSENDLNLSIVPRSDGGLQVVRRRDTEIYLPPVTATIGDKPNLFDESVRREFGDDAVQKLKLEEIIIENRLNNQLRQLRSTETNSLVEEGSSEDNDIVLC
eukprot:CAMPEP_0172430604 /NCGR_PEP_ID=MMETSP1064-20121228/55174_1 /TAXON_ID=202472 /ORGANISM="Aulacoseira subarctica , Strain CCAP 1002/5" /LENGTH=670 /DNA_ID=CAMNT_0013176775 /DNA_START=122 /DNA_END=2134 /DNA_ORIENTATION=+